MRRFVPAAPVAEPLSMINITPLIDVLLVLLIMMILTIPMMTNEIPIDLPGQGPVPAAERVVHRLTIARDGATALDGVAVAAAALPARLAVVRDDPNGALVLRTDPDARYDRFAQTLAVVKRAGITRLGFEGNRALE